MATRRTASTCTSVGGGATTVVIAPPAPPGRAFASVIPPSGAARRPSVSAKSATAVYRLATDSGRGIAAGAGPAVLSGGELVLAAGSAGDALGEATASARVVNNVCTGCRYAAPVATGPP